MERDEGQIPAAPAGNRVIDTLMLIRDDDSHRCDRPRFRNRMGHDTVQRAAFVGRLARRAIVKAGDAPPDPSRPRRPVAGRVSVRATVRTGRCMAHQV